MSIKYISKGDDINKLIKNSSILVIDFYSEECPPCEKLAPIYEKMATIFPFVDFVKIYRQENRELAASFDVSSSPTVIFFKNGTLLEYRLSGYIEENEIMNILEKICGENSVKPTLYKDASEYDLCIIGNGPAGMSAAIYGARYKIDLVLVGDIPGGQVTSAHKICNFPSEIEISGMDLSKKMLNQINALEVPQKNNTVSSIIQKDGMYICVLSNGEIIKSKTILLATGTKHRHLDLAKENKFTGRGISYCATCDAMFYKDKIVAVVGGSDSANTASLYLSQVASKVYQIYRGDSLRGETSWINEITSNSKIDIIYNTQITELIGEDKLSEVKLSKPINDNDILKIDGLFVEIGAEPDLNLVNQLSLETDNNHYIITKENQTTSREGVWAAGDITTNSNSFRQIITACSEGAIAAENIFKYLNVK